MEIFWKAALTVGGVAAIGAFIFWSLMKHWLTLRIFANLTKKQTFVLMIVFLALAFFAFAACVWAFLATNNQARSEPAADPKLVVMSLLVRSHRDDNQIKRYDLVKDGAAVDRSSLDVLRAYNDFKLSGQLSKPAFWCLAWLDSSGKAEVVASTAEKGTFVDYPSGGDFVSVDKHDPLGTHLILLLLSQKEMQSSKKAIQDAVQSVGKPPNQGSLAILVRGEGEKASSNIPNVPAFLNTISHKLPSAAHKEFGLFFQTVAD